ncbi:hypothetical protein [Sinorhizobium medicae]|uniref:hypothetical protein n=1 Tax=Sinorhizobium medicae TaxID=110321 RepID=UPI000FD76665|nr:hypothetical protein [Sinorhizobium medicae]RVJ67413.1 hypothetical protein CN168_33425 [Sinorhizobium medicae]
MINTLEDIFKVPLALIGLATICYLLCSVLAAIAFSVFTIPKRRDGKTAVVARELFLAGVPFSFLGMMIGYLTGISRESAVGTTVPAVLTLLGTVAAFIAANGGRRSALATVSIVFLAFALVVGVGYGARMRVNFTDAMQSLEVKRKQINDELQLQRYRAIRLKEIEAAHQANEQ